MNTIKIRAEYMQPVNGNNNRLIPVTMECEFHNEDVSDSLAIVIDAIQSQLGVTHEDCVSQNTILAENPDSGL